MATRRLERGLSSRQLAKMMGVSHSCLSRIENGGREIRLDMLRMLSAALGLEGEIIHYLRTGKF